MSGFTERSQVNPGKLLSTIFASQFTVTLYEDIKGLIVEFSHVGMQFRKENLPVSFKLMRVVMDH